MLKGAIFDLDGTLLDSTEIWETLAGEYLSSLGIIPKDDLERSITNKPLPQAYLYLKESYALLESVEEIEEGCLRILKRFYGEKAELKCGVKELIEEFFEEGVLMCIATASDKECAISALERLGVKKYFKEIVTCGEVGRGKEDPLIYRKALEVLNTEKEKVFIFEDTCVPAKTAHDDGFHVIGVFDRSEPNVSEMKKVCDFYVRDLTSQKEREELFKACRSV